MQFLTLRGGSLLQVAIVIEDPLLFLRRQILVTGRRNIRGWRTVRVHGSAAGAVPVWSWVPRGVAILRARRGWLPKLLPRLLVVLALLLALLLWLALLPLWLILRASLPLVGSRASAGIRAAIRTRSSVRRCASGSRRRSTTGAHMLRESRRNAEACTQQQRKHKPSELEFSPHASLHLLIRLTGTILLLL